jgi:predicted RNA-binding protein
MMKKTKETCYMCSAPSTGMEHAPPQCFFPEQKDLPPGVDLRKNLIKVPSCDKHNMQKSKEDEYLLFVVISHYENNKAAARQFITKILRAIARRPSLKAFYTATMRDIVWNGIPTQEYKPDWTRFTNGMKCIARALYFKHHKRQWSGPILIESPGFMMHEGAREILDARKGLAYGCDVLFEAEPRYGDNPEVFFYQVNEDLVRNCVIMRMTFFEGLQVIAMTAKKSLRTTEAAPNQIMQPTGRAGG